jgi:hypothetical protein
LNKELVQDNTSLLWQNDGNSKASGRIPLVMFTSKAGNEALLPAPLIMSSQNCISIQDDISGCHHHQKLKKKMIEY